MCLIYSEYNTNELRKAKGKKPFCVYKVYIQDKKKLHYFIRTGSPKISIDGTIESNRKSAELTSQEKGYKVIKKGIHVYLKREHIPPIFLEKENDDIVVLQCTVLPEDLVSVDSHNKHAVFTKIQVKPSVLTKYPANIKPLERSEAFNALAAKAVKKQGKVPRNWASNLAKSSAKMKD